MRNLTPLILNIFVYLISPTVPLATITSTTASLMDAPLTHSRPSTPHGAILATPPRGRLPHPACSLIPVPPSHPQCRPPHPDQTLIPPWATLNLTPPYSEPPQAFVLNVLRQKREREREREGAHVLKMLFGAEKLVSFMVYVFLHVSFMKSLLTLKY